MILQQERSSYHKHYHRFNEMGLEQLEQVLGDLGKKRYVDHDVECITEHRIAARVYIEKTRRGESLMFHLHNFMG
jgi:hypothetical protein